MIYSDDPTYGASIPYIQQVTGAPFSTARRWKLNPAKMPDCAARLVRFAVFGDLTEILGQEWRGFEFRGGLLYPPYFRGGFTPLQIAAMFFELQELRGLRREVKMLKAQLWAKGKLQEVVKLRYRQPSE